MYGNFVGIDISGNNARAVIVRRGLREEKMVKYFSSDSLSEFDILEHLSDNTILGYNFVAAINHAPISLRVLDFPFSDPRKISQVYRYELGNVSTFNADEKLVDYHMVRLKEGAEALVCMFEKQSLENDLESLSQFNIDPRYVTFSPFAFSAINHHLNHERPILLVDISENELSFSLFDENGLRRVRNSNNTIANLKQAVNHESFDFEDIEGNESARNRLLNSFEIVVDEIKRTAHYFETELKKPIKTFVLSGSICGITGIEDIIGKAVGSDVKKIFIPELGSKDSPFFAKAYSLALYGSKLGNAEFNLRTGDYKFQSKGFDIKRTFLLPASLLAIFLVLVLIKNTNSYLTTRSEIKSLNSEIQNEIKSVFPDATNLPDPVLFLNNQLREVQTKLNIINEVKGDLTPLDVMHKLSTSIPEDLEMNIDEIRFDSSKQLRVWGRCDSYNEIASIEKSLNESGQFESVERDQVSRAVNNTIKFVMSIALK